MAELQIDFSEIYDDIQRDAIFRLRFEVHSPSGAYADEFLNGRWIDSHDESAVHFAATADGNVIAAARLSLHAKLQDGPFGGHFQNKFRAAPGPYAVFSRLVVTPPFRNRGVAATLDNMRMTRARTAGATHAFAATSNPSRFASLARLGFKKISEERECELSNKVWGTLFACDLAYE